MSELRCCNCGTWNEIKGALVSGDRTTAAETAQVSVTATRESASSGVRPADVSAAAVRRADVPSFEVAIADVAERLRRIALGLGGGDLRGAALMSVVGILNAERLRARL